MIPASGNNCNYYKFSPSYGLMTIVGEFMIIECFIAVLS